MSQPKQEKKLGTQELAAQYGYAATFFNSDPELKKLLDQAVKEQWTTQRFQAAFQATNWYRSHAADMRTWKELQARDPAEAKKRTDQRWGQIRTLAAQMGVILSTDQVRRLTNDSLMLGWNDQLLQQAIGAEFATQSHGDTSGQAATTEAFVKRTAADYGVTISDSQIRKWTTDFLSGRAMEDHLVDWIRDMAYSKYPGLGAYLDKGMTVRQIAEPYMQSYAQILETPLEQIQLSDARIQRALQGVAAAKPGQPPASQTVYEFERDLRKDPRWRHTKNANDQMTNSTLGILKDWGLVS